MSALFLQKQYATNNPDKINTDSTYHM